MELSFRKSAIARSRLDARLLRSIRQIIRVRYYAHMDDGRMLKQKNVIEGASTNGAKHILAAAYYRAGIFY